MGVAYRPFSESAGPNNPICWNNFGLLQIISCCVLHLNAVSKVAMRALATVILCAWIAPSGAQDTSVLMAEGRMAFLEGRFAEAETVFERVLNTDSGIAEAHYMLARIYTEGASQDLSKAKKATDRALQIDPSNPDYLALHLYRLHFFPSSFLPAYQTARREKLAERILELDPGNSLAHLVLGEIALEDFLNARYSVSFPALDDIQVGAIHEAFFNAAYLLNPLLAEDADSEGVRFETGGRFRSHQIEYVTKDGEASKRLAKSIDHLWRSIEADPHRAAAYRSLITAYALSDDPDGVERVAESMLKAMPGTIEALLFGGMAAYRANRVSDAQSRFDEALGRMDGLERSAYESVDRLLTNSEREAGTDSDAFWTSRDPFLLTGENERRLEHLTRMVYADLRFGDMFADRRGWETEPGEVVIRYGLPLAEAQHSTRLDKYLVLHYGDFFFKFMDLAKSGRLTFYSPKAGNAAPDFEHIERAFDNDFAIIAPGIFRKTPERMNYDRHGTRVPFPFLTSVFRSAGDRHEVLVALGIPGVPPDRQVKTGIFALRNGAVDAADIGMDPPAFEVENDETKYSVVTRSFEIPPGTYDLSIKFDADDAVGVQRARLIVDKRNGLGISDLVPVA